MFIRMTFGLYAYYCYCATVGKQAIKCGYQGAGCFFIAAIFVLLFLTAASIPAGIILVQKQPVPPSVKIRQNKIQKYRRPAPFATYPVSVFTVRIRAFSARRHCGLLGIVLCPNHYIFNRHAKTPHPPYPRPHFHRPLSMGRHRPCRPCRLVGGSHAVAHRIHRAAPHLSAF